MYGKYLEINTEINDVPFSHSIRRGRSANLQLFSYNPSF